MNACQTCEGTGLVAGTRKSYDRGVWTDIPTKYRKTCPVCKGERNAN